MDKLAVSVPQAREGDLAEPRVLTMVSLTHSTMRTPHCKLLGEARDKGGGGERGNVRGRGHEEEGLFRGVRG